MVLARSSLLVLPLMSGGFSAVGLCSEATDSVGVTGPIASLVFCGFKQLLNILNVIKIPCLSEESFLKLC